MLFPTPSLPPTTTRLSAARRLSGCVFGIFTLALLGGCETGLDPAADDGSPPGLDVTQPFPIDRGDEGVQTPGKYKGLWLRLTDNGHPQVTPVDSVIGVVCLGMSNAQQECGDFIARITSHWVFEVSFDVRVVNCGIPGHAIEKWNDPEFDKRLWEFCIREALPFEGLRPDQIAVIYHKAANQETLTAAGQPLPTYPSPGSDFEAFHSNLSVFASRVRDFFPNAQAVYTSSRSYGGFATTPGRGEPLSYEEGHALNLWLQENPIVNGVWYGWGAYLWAPPCPTEQTNGGGVCYDRADYSDDGVHPTATGRGKVSWLMHHRLLEDSWYRR